MKTLDIETINSSHPTTLIKKFDEVVLGFIAVVVKTPQKQEALHQFVKFALIGVVNTAIDFGIYYMLTRHTALFDVSTWHKYIANIISFCIATTFSFFANRVWTFGRKDKATVGEAARFYSTTLSGLVLNSLLLLLLVRVLGIYDLIAKVFSTFVTIFWNFFLKRFWVFTPEEV
jgi:putative flippase GtrA